MAGYSCPTCSQGLNKTPQGDWHCGACKATYPLVAGSPFLWSEPRSALLDWRNRFNLVLADLEAQLEAVSLAEQTAAADGRAASQARLKHLAAGLHIHRNELNALMVPLAVKEPVAKETHLALKTRLSSHHGVLSYAQHIFRDWAWGQTETDAVSDHLAECIGACGDKPAENALILGGGAGRLAYDLHARSDLAWKKTTSLDSNPLLTMIGASVCAGETITFTEFPLAPIEPADVAITRELRAPAIARPGLAFICADAGRLPYADHSFDVVITPWLLDVLDLPVREFIHNIAALLKPGGLWVNHGSVAFTGHDPLARMTAPEIAELATLNGFEVVARDNTLLPYLQSPASRQQRSELTYTQVARRTQQVVEQSRKLQQVPNWLAEERLAVPLSKAFKTQITTVRVHAFIMSLIDGKRSIRDMAQVMEEQRLMPQAQARQAIKLFLTKMHEEANRYRGN